MSSTKKTKYMVKVAMLSVVSFLLMMVEFPIPLTPPWMKIDLSEIPVIFGGYAISPVAGITISFIKNLLHFLLKNNDGTIVGELASFLCGVALIIPSAFIFRMKKKKGNKWLVFSLIIGSVFMVVVASVLNLYVLIPVYSKIFMPLDGLIALANGVNPLITDIKSLILVGVIPFNVVKCIVVVLLTSMLYNKLEKYLKL